MKKALPLILIAGAVVAYMMYSKKQKAAPLQLGPAAGPSSLQKAAEAAKKVKLAAKKIAERIKAARAKQSSTIGFDDNSVLV